MASVQNCFPVLLFPYSTLVYIASSKRNAEVNLVGNTSYDGGDGVVSDDGDGGCGDSRECDDYAGYGGIDVSDIGICGVDDGNGIMLISVFDMIS